MPGLPPWSPLKQTQVLSEGRCRFVSGDSSFVAITVGAGERAGRSCECYRRPAGAVPGSSPCGGRALPLFPAEPDPGLC